ncbi:conserved hypothetical protein [Coccidioides posadasii str. Silveira]|uniref:Uncharacterized protein n=1 Tax=Coccidioides posadasii (strain RMSCC 757 / Silveira) TaxID=443226 RepID=E9DFF0_COCPS|nr:conserved hypothetical protein [Coccidioides posadasii str. Silveira]
MEDAPSNSLSINSGFAQLGKSQELQELFNQHPTLRSRLRDIHRITLEEEWIEMGRSIQSRSRGRGRDGYGQRPMNRGPWTIEKGFKRGLGRVRKWRESCEAGSGGADGAAFMRFIALNWRHVDILSQKYGIHIKKRVSPTIYFDLTSTGQVWTRRSKISLNDPTIVESASGRRTHPTPIHSGGAVSILFALWFRGYVDGTKSCTVLVK